MSKCNGSKGRFKLSDKDRAALCAGLEHDLRMLEDPEVLEDYEAVLDEMGGF